MTTPAFVAQDQSSLTEVRYYTPFDPYYYTVDNRPLQDISSNIVTISSGGGDSARRAVLLSELAMSDMFRDLYSGNTNGFISGLNITNPSSGTVRVNPGSLYFVDVINSSMTKQIVKQAILLYTQDLLVPAPLTSGQSANYLIQVQPVTITSTEMSTSNLPFLDATNTFLPGLLLNGELKVSVKAGAAASTGSQVTPSADSGWIPLYVVTSTNGASTPSVSFATGCPGYRGLNETLSPVYPGTSPATTTTVAGMPIPTFADSSTLSIGLPIPIQASGVSPYAPIKINIVASASVNSGNAQLQVGYLSLASGGSTASSVTSLTAEVVAAPSTANTLSQITLTETIPNSAFASFVNGAWVVSAKKLYVSLTRNGSATADTLSGNLYIHDVIVTQ